MSLGATGLKHSLVVAQFGSTYNPLLGMPTMVAVGTVVVLRVAGARRDGALEAKVVPEWRWDNERKTLRRKSALTNICVQQLISFVTYATPASCWFKACSAWRLAMMWPGKCTVDGNGVPA